MKSGSWPVGALAGSTGLGPTRRADPDAGSISSRLVRPLPSPRGSCTTAMPAAVHPATSAQPSPRHATRSAPVTRSCTWRAAEPGRPGAAVVVATYAYEPPPGATACGATGAHRPPAYVSARAWPGGVGYRVTVPDGMSSVATAAPACTGSVQRTSIPGATATVPTTTPAGMGGGGVAGLL